MEYRRYELWDEYQIQQVHYNSVHSLDCYSQIQKNTLSPLIANLDEWRNSLSNTNTFVAVENWIIVWFGDIKNSGYIKRLYVDPNYFGRKIWETLLKILEKEARNLWVSEITLDATLNSIKFYQKYLYELLEEKEYFIKWQKFNVYFLRKLI